MFTQNVGSLDRIVRIILGIGLFFTGFFVLTGVVGFIVGAIGLISLITGAMGWCPMYLPFKFSTRKS